MTSTPPDGFEPVQVGRSVDAVLDRLVTAIAVGDFTPGERLPPERELAVLLGVGRQTLRAALARLRDAGYVATRRGRAGGAFVQEHWGPLSDGAVRRTVAGSAELAALSDARCLLESLIARTAAERRDHQDVEAMRVALAAFVAAARSPADGAAIRRADQEMHRAIIAAAGNAHLARMSRDLLAQLNIGLPIEPYNAALLQLSIEQHTALVAAIEAGDADGAAAVARVHFTITTDAVERAARRAGF
ncbi:FadR/GntR family transcriptional regulator [Pseudonocardia sp. GCM10023141]|uniref:FadR/GntR family transcriptional regulator n=1 Tax=Pseudonocardia sp. GCM10023141 TaxID=3252653 RepID=UPI00360C68BC